MKDKAEHAAWPLCLAIVIALTCILGTGCGSGSNQFGGIEPPPPAPKLVYATNFNSQNISAYIESSNGTLTPMAGAPFAAGPHMNNLVVNPSGTLLYAVGYDVSSAGSVWAYTIASGSGILMPVSGSPYAVWLEPLSLTMDPAGKFLFVGDYQSALISVFSVNTNSGALTEIIGSPFLASGSPRILAMHPSGQYLYAADDVTDSIWIYSVSASGGLTEIGGSDYSDMNRPWGITITPDGKYLYAADEAGNTLEGFSIAADGSLTALANSPFATSAQALFIGVDPSGKFVYTANFFSDNVTGLTIDSSTGNLTQMANSPFTTGSGTTSPWGIAFDSTGQFAYIANSGASTIAAFSVDSSGNLAEISGSPYTAGSTPTNVVTVVGQAAK